MEQNKRTPENNESISKDRYIEETQARIDGLQNQVDAYRSEMDAYDEDAKINLETSLTGLENRLANMRRQLAEVEAASENEWQDLQAQVDQTGGDVLDAFEALQNDVEPPAVSEHRNEPRQQ